MGATLLNIPFAYNLPRYKDLCVDGLFDMNRPGDKGCGKDKNITGKDAEPDSKAGK